MFNSLRTAILGTPCLHQSCIKEALRDFWLVCYVTF